MVNKRMLMEIGISATAGIAIGYGAGLFVADRKVKKLLIQLDHEISEYKDMMERKTKTGQYANPKHAYEKLVAEDGTELLRDTDPEHQTEYAETLANLEYSSTDDQSDDEDSKDVVEKGKDFIQNVFDNEPKDAPEASSFIPNELMADRKSDGPYLISIGEFMEDDELAGGETIDKITLNWFVGDETMCDDREQIIPDSSVEAFIGKKHLSLFGTGSDNEDVVYVRNEKLHTDYEITREPGSFSEVVLGMRKD